LPILLGIEFAEMLADDLCARVLMDAPSARIPVGDIAVGIEHEDGVIGDALNEQPKSPFTFHECLLRLAALTLLGATPDRDVLDDKHEMMRHAVRIADGGSVVAEPEALPVGEGMTAFDDEAISTVDGLVQQTQELGYLVGVPEVLNAHAEQFGRRTLHDVAKLLIEQNELSRGIGQSDAHTGLIEHAAQIVFAVAQSGLEAILVGDLCTEGKARDRHGKHEHGQ
jgi:hypothetical protein